MACNFLMECMKKFLFHDLRRFLCTKTKDCCNVLSNWYGIKLELETETLAGKQCLSINLNIRTTKNILWKVIGKKKIVYNRHSNYFQDISSCYD